MSGPFSRSVSILIYHRVVPEPDPLMPEHIDAGAFDRQLAVLDRWFKVMPLRDVVRGLCNGTLPVRAASLTFDDGYADNVAVALPILRKRGLPATFFVATGFLRGETMWNDRVIEAVRRARGGTLDARCVGLGALSISTIEQRRRAIEGLLAALKYRLVDDRHLCVGQLTARTGSEPLPGMMMTTAQLRYLHASGMEIGAHTVNHPILANLDAEHARIEVRESKLRLEEILGKSVTLFAYPNGKPRVDYGLEHVAMVRELGFEAAVSTAWGVANAGSDRFQLPRFTPWDRTPGRCLLRLMHNTFRTTADRV